MTDLIKCRYTTYVTGSWSSKVGLCFIILFIKSFIYTTVTVSGMLYVVHLLGEKKEREFSRS